MELIRLQTTISKHMCHLSLQGKVRDRVKSMALLFVEPDLPIWSLQYSMTFASVWNLFYRQQLCPTRYLSTASTTKLRISSLFPNQRCTQFALGLSSYINPSILASNPPSLSLSIQVVIKLHWIITSDDCCNFRLLVDNIKKYRNVDKSGRYFSLLNPRIYSASEILSFSSTFFVIVCLVIWYSNISYISSFEPWIIYLYLLCI